MAGPRVLLETRYVVQLGDLALKSAGDDITVGNLTVTGDIAFTGLGKRIKGDFSNLVRPSRTLFVDSNAGAGSNVGVIPNGVSNVAAWTAFGSSDPDNSQFILMASIGATTVLNSGITGTGTQRALELQIGGVTRLGIETDGRLYGTALHDNATLPSGTTKNYWGSGTYTPSAIASVNITAITPEITQWIRVGNCVVASLRASVQATAAGLCNGRLSIPIPSGFSASRQCSGSGSWWDIGTPAVLPVGIEANVANDSIDFYFVAPGAGAKTLTIHVTYLVQ